MDDIIRTCIKCNIDLPEKPTESSGYKRKICYSCKYEQTKIVREQRKEENLKNISNVLKKQCFDCKNEKQISEFNRRLVSNDGFNPYCKDCYKLRRKKKSTENTQSSLQTKQCIKCTIVKPINEYKPTKRSNDGYYHTCKTCLKPIQWNKEKQKLSEQKYIRNNIEKVREKWRRDGKKINRIVRDRLNHRIRDALLNSGQRKTNKTSSFVGCDITYLKKWFEFQFTDIMNWESIHLWHIDHVNPCNAYDLSKVDEQLKCFNWTNLRPCWITENLNKSGKIDTSLIEDHKIIVEQFILQSTTKSS